MSSEHFPDADLIAYVRKMYGRAMAEKVTELFELDPDNETGFCNSVRRSLTREVERSLGKDDRSHPDPFVQGG